MVLTNQMKTSALAKKKMKQEYKGKKKDNYKKKNIIKEECCICYNDVDVCSDNMIKCGTANHTICRSCKVQMKGIDCPMCRSHKVKQPIHQIVKIKIIQKPKKPKPGVCPLDSIINPKQKRKYRRKSIYEEVFGPNTNRIQRQRSNRTGRLNQSGLYHYNTQNNMVNNHWFSQEQVLLYNGSLRTDYDSASDYSEDSDSDSDSYTISTLSITDTELGERVEELVNAWDN